MSLVLGLALALSAPAAAAERLRSGSFITFEVRGEEALAAEGRHLEMVSVFAWALAADGGVVAPGPWVDEALARLMADPGGRVILATVVNDISAATGRPGGDFNGDVTYDVLADPARRARHVRELVALAARAHGVELDYERLPGRIRPVYTEFIRELRAALPPGKRLSLVLQPKTDNAVGDRGRALDWRAVEPYADHMRIMAYYYAYAGSAHGPVAPMEQLRRVARYALDDPEQGIPPGKLGVILSFYGWDWPLPEGSPGELISYASATALAAAHGAAVARDPVELTLNFRYPGPDGAARQVWIDDFESLRARIELLEAEGVPRVDFWHVATGDPRIWDYIAARTAPADGGPAAGGEKPRAYPNPWRADLHAGAPMRFDRLAGGSRVRIFTASGRWVRTLEAPAGTADWDLSNDAGQAVASGYYLYVAEGGGEPRRGVVVVVR